MPFFVALSQGFRECDMAFLRIRNSDKYGQFGEQMLWSPQDVGNNFCNAHLSLSLTKDNKQKDEIILSVCFGFWPSWGKHYLFVPRSHCYAKKVGELRSQYVSHVYSNFFVKFMLVNKQNWVRNCARKTTISLNEISEYCMVLNWWQLLWWILVSCEGWREMVLAQGQLSEQTLV